MKAQFLRQCGDISNQSNPLEFCETETPEPGRGEILLRVRACGVCHTELDEIEGRTPPPIFPVILGHQVVAEVAAQGTDATKYRLGERVGVAWIYSACGKCEFCRQDLENLCPEFCATGRDVNGGYAEYMVAREDFVHPIPGGLSDIQAAPLLCAGAIGYRSLHLSGLDNGRILGLTGFGGSGHLVLQMVRHRFPESPVFVFARSRAQQQFALELGATWAGKSDDPPPELMHAVIDTTPAWKPVIDALEFLRPGGRLVINAIRKERQDQEQLLRLEYEKHLWLEKEVKSVANVCRSDVREFLVMAAEIGIEPEVECYSLSRADVALRALKDGAFRGAKVLT
ncbi:MAG TPA: alcohol dehydrogenase, partial [Desulfobulbus sp.]|nr:alcohol dehydrogenase [Desulfobulbus sp.]